MRGIRICLIAAIALGVAGITGAAGPMVLTRNGDFYSAGTRDNQVVLTARYADGLVSEISSFPNRRPRSKAPCRWKWMKRPAQFTSCGRSGPDRTPGSDLPATWMAPGSDQEPLPVATEPPLQTLPC